MVKLKTVRTDEDIHDAVKGWIRSRHEAEVKYGPMPEWDTSKVTNMSRLFQGMPGFNEDISGWNVANVTTMYQMFYEASSFNQPLDQWNVANVTTMKEMFWHASSFNQPLEQWDVANVTTMESMFYDAYAYYVNAEQYPRPLWARNDKAGLQRWKELYKLMAFKAVVVGEHVRADREKTDGSAAGVAVGAIAQVLTSEYLAAEILAFL
jgi:surface protein